MKRIFFILFIPLFLTICACEDDSEFTSQCEEDSLAYSDSIVFGKVLKKCVDGEWYMIKECNDAAECPRLEADPDSED